jgi:hypothetical protein
LAHILFGKPVSTFPGYALREDTVAEGQPPLGGADLQEVLQRVDA